MSKYVIKRCIHSLGLLWLLSILLFTLIKSMPSDPVSAYLGMHSNVSVEEKQQMRKQLGLDESYLIQYQTWITNFVKGDWGTSFTYKKEVKDVLSSYAGNSVLLYVSGISIAIFVSLHIAYLKQKAQRIHNRVLNICVFGNSMPLFFVALIVLFAAGKCFPNIDFSGMYSTYYVVHGYDSIFIKIFDILLHMALPLLVIVFSLSCVFIPYLSGVIGQIFQQDYILFAKAKGTSKRKLFYRHVLRNALVPILQLLAMYLPLAISGSVVIETIFSWPGIGHVLIQAIQNKDVYLANACLMVYAIAVIVLSLLVDIICAFVNPTWKEELR